MPSQLYLFDCGRQVDISVPTQPGSAVTIGRDSILQCNDPRISRNHGTLKLTADEAGRGTQSVQITSTHSNPIFIRTGADGVLNILAKDLTATLKKGDKFALLPDQYWYEVRFGDDDDDTGVTSSGPALRVRTMEEVNSGPIPEAQAGEKRKNGADSEADCTSKRAKSEDTEDEVVTSNQDPPEEPPNPTVIKPDPDGNEVAEGSSSSGPSAPKSPQQSAKPAVQVKKETPDSTGPPARPSCQFGIACYRHTADHRAAFAHPLDVDYRRPAFPPAPDDAPHCPFGASCYRRNPQHFREYQHPDSSEYEASATAAPPVNVVRLPAIHVPAQPHRNRNQFARDVLMAAILNGDDTESGDDDDDDELDDGGRSLFGSASDSDEYHPGGDDADTDSELELESNGEQQDEE